MINETVQKAINDQINEELYSAYVYLAMSAYFENTGFGGFASWMRAQAREEQGHAMRLFDYLVDRGGVVELGAIKAPPLAWDSPLDVFADALEHERHVTARIHALHELAVEHRDPATQIEMQWFVTEQVEEEKSAGDVVEQLQMAGDNRGVLLMLDRQLGQRQGD